MFFSKVNEIEKMMKEYTVIIENCFTNYMSIMTEIVNEQNQEQYSGFMVTMKQLESEADKKRHALIRQLLEGGLVLDSRKSLMHVIEGLDGVADLAEEIVREFYLTHMPIETATGHGVLQMNQVIHKQLLHLIETVVAVVTTYDLESLFSLLTTIEQLETEVDVIQQRAIKEIYNQELSLAEKMQQRVLIDKVAKMADDIEDVSDLIEIIMMTRKV